MGIYIETWGRITKEQVEADENLNVIYEVDDNTKIRAIELKDNKDSYAVWMGNDECNLFRLNRSIWEPLFNYLFHKYGLWYCIEYDTEDIYYEENEYLMSADLHTAYIDFVDKNIDYYTEEEKKEREKMLDWANGITDMVYTKQTIEHAFYLDKTLSNAISRGMITEKNYDELLSIYPNLGKFETTRICEALQKKLAEGIDLLNERIKKEEIAILKTDPAIKNEASVITDDYTETNNSEIIDDELPF